MKNAWEYELVNNNTFWYWSLLLVAAAMFAVAGAADLALDWLVEHNHPELFMGDE